MNEIKKEVYMKQGWKALILTAVVVMFVSSACLPPRPGHPGRTSAPEKIAAAVTSHALTKELNWDKATKALV